MRKKACFIQPTYRDASGRLFHGNRLLYSSLALPALSATIPPDWEKEFCLEYFKNVNYETDASVIGISSMGYDIIHGIEIAQEFKRRGKTVVFGGPQAHFTKGRVRPVCDAVVHGHPSPHEMKRILDDALQNRLAPEYQCGMNVSVPFDYSILPHRKIDFMPVLTSIGCCQKCTFCCTAALYGGFYRLRKLDHVLSDLCAVRKITRRAVFVDANIYNNRDYLLRLCARMKEEGFGLQWAAQCTVDIADDEEVLEALRAAGCLLLIVGFETLEQANLDQLGKPFRVERCRERVRRIQSAGIAVGGYFMLGLDGDTAGSFDAMYDFIHDAKIALPVLNLLLPAPGTRVFEQLKQEGRLRIQDEEDYLLNNLLYSTACNRCFYVPKQMSVSEAEKKFYALYRKLSSFREIVRRSISACPILSATLFTLNLAMRSECRAMAGSRAVAGVQ